MLHSRKKRSRIKLANWLDLVHYWIALFVRAWRNFARFLVIRVAPLVHYSSADSMGVCFSQNIDWSLDVHNTEKHNFLSRVSFSQLCLVPLPKIISFFWKKIIQFCTSSINVEKLFLNCRNLTLIFTNSCSSRRWIASYFHRLVGPLYTH